MISFGPICIYSLESAMHGAVNIHTKRWGYVCFKLPTFVFGRWWPAYFYLSPNATPWGATILIGRRFSRGEKSLACVRRALWGHGYSQRDCDPQQLSSYTDPIVRELPCGEFA